MLKNFTDYDRADVRWQWQRNPLGFWEDIPGATEMTYTVTEEDQDCRLRLCYNVGMGTDVHGMFTNEVTCGKTYAGEVSLTVSSNAIELDFLNPDICGVDYGIDSCMWIGDVGQTGINGVARLIAGEVSPSGSIVDTFTYDNMTNPAMYNFYTQAYPNAADYDLMVDGPDVQGM